MADTSNYTPEDTKLALRISAVLEEVASSKPKFNFTLHDKSKLKAGKARNQTVHSWGSGQKITKIEKSVIDDEEDEGGEDEDEEKSTDVPDNANFIETLLQSFKVQNIQPVRQILIRDLPHLDWDSHAVFDYAGELLIFAKLLELVQESFYPPGVIDQFVTRDKQNTEMMNEIMREQLGIPSFDQFVINQGRLTTDKISHQRWKRWRRVYVRNNPALITSDMDADMKEEILKRIVSVVERAPLQETSSSEVPEITIKDSADKLFGYFHPGACDINKLENTKEEKSALKAMQNRFLKFNRFNHVTIVDTLQTKVANVQVTGLTNFPQMFNVIKDSFKIREKGDVTCVRSKLLMIKAVIDKFHGILQCPEVFVKKDRLDNHPCLGGVWKEAVNKLNAEICHVEIPGLSSLSIN